MSLVSQVTALTTRLGTEFKTVYGRIGALASLSTTTKTDLVSAINEVNAKPTATGGAAINDTTPSSTTTYSSSKSDSLLAAKAPTASPTFTGTVAGIDKTMVGLANVDNTADSVKPVSTPQQTALNLKAPLASPAFTGTVTGISKAMVGLSNVDNTTDAGKPVSTAQQAALDLKAPIASPSFTGTVSGITKAMVGLGSVDNTADSAKPVSTAQAAAIAALINDASLTTATGTTYSANKINAAISAAVSALVAASPAALDTLNELALAIGNDANFATTTATALGNRLRVDISNQALTGTQQANARTNLAVYSTVEIGDPNTDFVASFNAALV